ncbi:MAG: hypothetical protein RKO24_12145 [Candidatus Competibacter sp.]|nr:hypothetical protein [Candidatus Competibacter sp.]
MNALKALPAWIVALAILIAASFIGYGVYDNRLIELWPPKIHPKSGQTPGVTSQVEYLKNFTEVLDKATEVISVADSELWMAVDVPAYGAVSQPKAFDRYEAAILASAPKPRLARNVLWFGESLERKYNERVANLKPDELKFQDENGKRLRKALGSSVASDLAVLAHHNFWMSKDKSGVHHVVIAWFALDPTRASELVGIYTQSPDLAEMLTGLWAMWKKQSDEKFSATLLKMYEP